jgi:hypothetical protein
LVKPVRTVVVLALAILAVAVFISRSGGSSPPPASPSPPVSPPAAAPVTSVTPARLPVRLTRVGGAPASPVWAAGALWLATGTHVARLDPVTLRFLTDHRVRAQCKDSQMIAALGALWLTSGDCLNPGELTRIDVTTGRPVSHLGIPAIAEGVSVGAGRLVVSTLEGGGRRALVEVGPGHRGVTDLSGTAGTTTLVATPAGFWGEPSGFGGAARIVVHGRRVETSVFYATQTKAGLAYGDGIVFAGLGDAVLQLDPSTGDPLGRPLQPPGAIAALAYGANAVWIATGDGRIYHYAPGDRRLLLVTRLPWRVTSLTAGGGFLWAAGYSAGSVARIGPIPAS